MKGKVAFVLGAAVGYVCGTRAGRERYEQIKTGAQKVWHTAPVQRAAGAVRATVDQQLAQAKQTAVGFGAQVMGSFVDRAQSARPAKTTPADSAAATAESAARDTDAATS